ncbi:MAG: CCA tRNA nucleotidyltransferase [Desulfobacterales bacterium]|nr:CCA tRNA nucleotidyltransferase [Desulfobacterales bacterium]
MKISDQVSSWFEGFSKLPLPVYLVGGAVRDFIILRESKDLDIVCNDAYYLSKILQKKHNATIVNLFKNDEIKSTYRVVRKVKTGLHDEIDISSFQGKDIIEDLSNRDFTINAMAISINKEGKFEKLIDPFNGKSDLLENKIVRMVSPESLKNDPLRILRAYRFSAVLDFKIESKTKDMIKKYLNLLDNVASERKLVELKGIVKSDKAYKTILDMDLDKVLETIFPEILLMKGCGQNTFHHLDVWDHSLMTLQECEKILSNIDDYFGNYEEPIKSYLNANDHIYLLKLAALLHDIGKPCARKIIENKVVFYEHEHIGAEIIRNIGERLKMSNYEIDYLYKIIDGHMRPLGLNDSKVKQKTLFRWFREVYDDSIAILILSIADANSALGKSSSIEEKIELIKWVKETLKLYFDGIKNSFQKPSLITGNDLIQIGVLPGPNMGNLLKIIREMQDIGEITTKENALEYIRKMLSMPS